MQRRLLEQADNKYWNLGQDLSFDLVRTGSYARRDLLVSPTECLKTSGRYGGTYLLVLEYDLATMLRTHKPSTTKEIGPKKRKKQISSKFKGEGKKWMKDGKRYSESGADAFEASGTCGQPKSTGFSVELLVYSEDAPPVSL